MESCSLKQTHCRCSCLPTHKLCAVMLHSIWQGFSFSTPQNHVWGSPLIMEQSWAPSCLLPALTAPAHLFLQQIKESTRFCVTKRSPSMGSATQYPPRAIDLHVVFGAGAYRDPRLQHKEHVETHLHILYSRNLQKEAQSVRCCFLEQGKRNSFTERRLCLGGGQKITEKGRSVFQQEKKQLHKSD